MEPKPTTDDRGSTLPEPRQTTIDPGATLPHQTANLVDMALRANLGPHTDNRLGRYEVLGRLGAGGMGEVLHVRDGLVGRDVAAKLTRGLPSRETLAKFVVEGQITGQLQHPGIIPVYELGLTPNGRLYFTMKHVVGRTMSDCDDLPNDLRAFLQVCDAIRFAHSRGVIHRDLKPDNIMVGEFGEVLVLDWGLAKIERRRDSTLPPITLDPAALSASLGEGVTETVDGQIKGTPAYMAPEQARGDIEAIDRQTDVYGLGAILYQLVAGVPPFNGLASWEVLSQVAMGALEPPSTAALPDKVVPRELEAIILRAMATDPDRRYPDVTALRADVAAYLDGRLVGVARYGPVEVAWKWARRHKAATSALLAISAAVLVAIGWSQVQAHRRDQARARRVADARSIVTRMRERQPLERARTALRDAPAALRSRDVSPTARQRADFARRLLALQRLADALGRLQALTDDDSQIVEQRGEALTTIARLAALGEDHALALLALRRARALPGVEPSTISALAADIGEARTRRLARRARVVDRLLARARAGELRDAEEYRAALIELASYRDATTIERLSATLSALAASIQHRAREALLAVAAPTPAERRDLRWQPLELAPAVDAWFARDAALAAGKSAPAVSDDAWSLINRARLRLEARGRKAFRLHAPSWSEALANAQSAALPAGDGGRQLVALLCDALGHLGDPSAIDALAAYAAADQSASRAASAGRALARLTAHSEEAERRLLALVTPASGPPRWAVEGDWWRALAPIYRRHARSSTEATDASYARALRRHARGDLAGAEADLTAVLQRTPADVDARLQRAHVRRANARLDAALADYDAVVRAEPDRVDAHFGRGATREDRREYGRAIADYTAVLSREPRHARAMANRGICRRYSGDLDGAIADFDGALAIDGELVPPRLHRARILQRRGQLAEANAELDRAVALAPDYELLRRVRGEIRLTRDDVAGALADFERAVELDPDQPWCFIWRSRARQAGGDLAGARADLDRAVSLAPRDGLILYYRASFRGHRGDRRGALEEMNRAVVLSPNQPDVHYGRGTLRFNLGDLRGALQDYDRALALDPDHYVTLINRGQARTRGGDHQGAIRDLRRAVSLRRADADARITLSEALSATGDRAGARRELDELLTLNPKSVRGWIARGVLKTRSGDQDGAIADLTHAMTLAPRNTHAIYCRGVARGRAGDTRGALADYGRALAIEPTYGEARVNRAWIHQKAGRLRAALADLDRAVAARPQLIQARYSRGVVHRRLGELAKAEADLTRAIEMTVRKTGRAPSTGHYERGLTRAARGNHAGAATDFATTARVDRAHWAARLELGRAYLRLGRKADAHEALSEARRLAPAERHATIDALLSK